MPRSSLVPRYTPAALLERIEVLTLVAAAEPARRPHPARVFVTGDRWVAALSLLVLLTNVIDGSLR
jgi:hypothetical protein